MDQSTQDSLDSLHSRMDKFYAWAAELQLQMRNIQSRQTFLESQIEMNHTHADEFALQARLEKMKKK